MIVNLKIGESELSYIDNPSIHVSGYYNHCVSKLTKALGNLTVPINVIFGSHDFLFDNYNKTLRGDIQCEHTLVKIGGRSISEVIVGNIPTGDGDNYLVRIDKFNYFNSLDFVIEYSRPNMVNIGRLERFNDYYKKLVYIPADLYDKDFSRTLKTDTITLFNRGENIRRECFLDTLEARNISNVNVSGLFSLGELQREYETTRILINIHQTDHHHTFEELRVLPALCRGVLVVSEDVPLKEWIPYNEFIIWAKYENLADKVKEVQDNYEKYYDQIFNNGNLEVILAKLEYQTDLGLKSLLNHLVNKE